MLQVQGDFSPCTQDSVTRMPNERFSIQRSARVAGFLSRFRFVRGLELYFVISFVQSGRRVFRYSCFYFYSMHFFFFYAHTLLSLLSKFSGV